MKDRIRFFLFRSFVVVIDIMLLIICFKLAYIILTRFDISLFHGRVPIYKMYLYDLDFVLFVPIYLMLMYFFGIYERVRQRQGIGLLFLFILVNGIYFLIITNYYFFMKKIYAFPRPVIILYCELLAIFMFVFHYIVGLWASSRKKKRVLIIGVSDESRSIIDIIKETKNQELEIVGIMSIEKRLRVNSINGVNYLGNMSEIKAVCSKYKINQVIMINEKPLWQEDLLDMIKASRRATPELLVFPSTYEIHIGKTNFKQIHDIPLIDLKMGPSNAHLFVKRTFDIVFSMLLIIVSLPLLLISMIAIKLEDSKGSIFYKQERPGKNGKKIVILKLRTMKVCESSHKTTQAQKGDSRITRVGRILRKFRIDEIPQLFNVLKGDMSIVGPRPLPMREVKEFRKYIKNFNERLIMKPGVTSLSQVVESGGYHTKPEFRIRYDLTYIYNYSLWLDIVIIFKTVKTVLTGKGV